MNRSEYLEGLARSLDFLNEENRSAALAFYAEMLDDRIEDGMSEEDATDKMESIEAIAARFRAEYGAQPIAEETPAQEAEPQDAPAPEAPAPEASVQEASVQEAPAQPEVVVETMPLSDQAADNGSRVRDDVSERMNEARERINEIDARFAERAAERAARQAEREARQAEREARQATWEEKAERFTERGADLESTIENTVHEAADMAQSAAREAIAAAREALREAEAQVKSAARAGSDAPSEPVIKTVKAPADAVKVITVSAGNVGVRIEKSDAGEASVSYYTDEFTLYDTSFENGNLCLKRLSNSILDGNQMFRLFKHGFSFHRSIPDIVVRVPQDSLIDLDLTTSNAGMSLASLRGLGAVRLKSSNAPIRCDTASMISLNLKTSNSRIELHGVNVKRDIEARTSNSHLDAQSVFGGGDITLVTSNSRLTAAIVKADGTLTLTTNNGGLNVEKLLARAYRLRTSNAAITGTLPGNASIYRISSGTSNGKNSLPPHQAGEIPLEAFTSNGSIRLTFEDA